MHVCLMSAEYPPEGKLGGIATYTKKLAHSLTRLGHKVTVISSTANSDFSYDNGGVNVHRIHGFPVTIAEKIRYPAYPLNAVLNFSYRVFKKFEAVSKQDKIDIVEAPENLATAAVLFKRRSDIASVTRLHTPSYLVRELNGEEITKKLETYHQLEQEQTLYSRAVTSPTKALADIVAKKWNLQNIEVIPNFFDLEEYKPDESVYNSLFSDGEYLLYYGRLEVRKGVHIFAEALSSVLRKYPNIKVGFVGKGMTCKDGTPMKDYILKLNSDFVNRLIFVEHIPYNQLYPIIERAKLVVLPSIWENFPYTCLEAMSFGKTVLASSGSGYNEIIEDGVSGYLVEPGNAKKLSERISEFLEVEQNLVIGKNAKEKVKDFASELITRKTLEFYDKICAQQH